MGRRYNIAWNLQNQTKPELNVNGTNIDRNTDIDPDVLTAISIVAITILVLIFTIIAYMCYRRYCSSAQHSLTNLPSNGGITTQKEPQAAPLIPQPVVLLPTPPKSPQQSYCFISEGMPLEKSAVSVSSILNNMMGTTESRRPNRRKKRRTRKRISAKLSKQQSKSDSSGSKATKQKIAPSDIVEKGFSKKEIILFKAASFTE